MLSMVGSVPCPLNLICGAGRGWKELFQAVAAEKIRAGDATLSEDDINKRVALRVRSPLC